MIISSKSPYILINIDSVDENNQPTHVSIDLNWQASELLDIVNLIYHELGYTRSSLQYNLREMSELIRNTKYCQNELEKDLKDNPALKASFESLFMMYALGKQKEKQNG